MQDAQFVLRRLAQQTGGRAFFPQEIKELASVYGDIRDELSSQYSLAYESSSPYERRPVAPHRGSRQSSKRGGPHEAGLLRTEEVVMSTMRYVPLCVAARRADGPDGTRPGAG